MKFNMLTKAKSFLSSWKNLLALGTLIPLGGWIYSRVWMVNPAILGDEYLYSMNARKAAPWDPSPAGDFSNYLFNFVYQGTNLCGEAFYTCGKIFNLFFFLGFIFTLYIVAIRFLPFWAAYGFMIAASLSPLSVYTSMFLPESMYMFFMGLLLIAVLHAMKGFSWQNWALAGAAIGLASLVKPHAWLSAIAVGITLLIVGFGNREIGIKKTSVAIGALIAGSVISRVVVGLVVAGPKALGFFGQYLGSETVEQVISGTEISEAGEQVSNPALSGVLSLFLPQLNVHFLVTSAIMAISVVGLLVGMLEIVRTKKANDVAHLALFSLVWLFSLMIEIVVFTGWVTGTGDDHTTRVLLRYYEFLFVIVPLAGMSIFANGFGVRTPVWMRWGLAGIFTLALTPAFTGYFSTLTIQIADAPTLAGLVVNLEVFNAVAIFGFAALLIFATFPKYTALVFIALLPASMIGTGWQIQDQYQTFRGTLSPADMAGQYLKDTFSATDVDKTLILASTRFEATNAAVWADSYKMSYELFVAESQVAVSSLPTDRSIIVALSGIEVSGAEIEPVVGEGFKVYILNAD